MFDQPLLSVKNLQVAFLNDRSKFIPVVNDISFDVHEGEILGIVGESGSGKSVTSLSIMGLLPNNGKIINGDIDLKGQEIKNLPDKQMQNIRGKEIGMVFQEPMTSLDPLFTIGEQLSEGIKKHNKSMRKKDITKRAIDLLKQVELPRPEHLIKSYPNELSGGMRQRVLIAMAIACNPAILIADEPTTALDVTIQAEIIQLMKKINKAYKMSIILITHDLGVVAQICQRVVVMYAGKVVEEGSAEEIFDHPCHPYTVGLLQSVPDIRKTQQKLKSIEGSVPRPGSIDHGCYFANRCQYAESRCFKQTPPLYSVGETQKSRCFLNLTNDEGKERSNKWPIN